QVLDGDQRVRSDGAAGGHAGGQVGVHALGRCRVVDGVGSSSAVQHVAGRVPDEGVVPRAGEDVLHQVVRADVVTLAQLAVVRGALEGHRDGIPPLRVVGRVGARTAVHDVGAIRRCSLIERVVAVLAVLGVGSVPALDGVVAVPALQDVGPPVAGEGVVE